MTPKELAEIHRRAFAPSRGWRPEEFQALLQQQTVQLFEKARGFALVRTIADEAELLTIAVDPDAQRGGVATEILQEWLDRTPANTAFLEVAADNSAALSLYIRLGFVQHGCRKGYYPRSEGAPADALLLRFDRTNSKPSDSTPAQPKTG